MVVPVIVTLADGDNLEQDFTVSKDTTLANGVIAGYILGGTDEGVTGPINGALVTLRDNTNTTIASTFSADDGEFVFYDVADGTYTVVASYFGYAQPAPETVIVSNGSLSNITITLDINYTTHSGTVNGVITDGSGSTVSGCYVGLYQVTTKPDDTKSHTLVAYTKTNAKGQYLFGGVGTGTYVVKAKMNK